MSQIFLATNGLVNWFTGYFRGSKIQNLFCSPTMAGDRVVDVDVY